jgi:DNA-binding response OmpR family regulator
MVQMDNQLGSHRILIADDDPIVRELGIATLEDAGYEVSVSADGASAMEKLMATTFDLAIIDLLMPKIDGLRLIGLIRATRNLRGLPILVITSQLDPSILEEGLQVGANDYMTKPVNWPDMPARIESLIEQVRKKR